MVISIIGLIIWIAIFNIAGMILLIQDKKRARRHMRRIPEKTLMWVGCLGGAPLMLVTMYLIHHKTHRKKFTIGFPIAIACMAALLLFMWFHPDQFVFYWTVFSNDIYLES